jgi:mannose-6-phosphate isomerase-like protein (cupin superfamily)
MSEDDYALFDDYYHDNIEEATIQNNFFRKVLCTTSNLQLVLMSLKPGEDIGIEIHPYTTQFIRVEKGDGIAIIEGKKFELYDGVAIIIPNNSRHNIINTSKYKDLKLYTIYSPPNHPYDRIEKNKTID